MKISLDYIITKLVILYLGIGSVFWFASIKLTVFSKLKLLLFAFISFLVFYSSFKKNKSKLSVSLILFPLVLLITSLSGFLQSSFVATLRMLNIFLLLGIVPTVFYLFFKDKTQKEVKNIFIKSSYIVSFFCLLTIINYLFGIPDWKFVKEGYQWGDYVSLYDNGFSTTRTSWSNGLSLYFLVMLFYFYKERKISYAVVGSIILLSQFLSGGRTGLLISLIFLAQYIFFRINLKYGVIILSLLCIGIVSQKEFLIKRLRLDRVEKKTSKLNDFSSGRIYHVEFGINKLKEDYNTIKGSGFLKDSNKINGKNEIHNFWIKTFLEGGIFYLLTYVFFVILFALRMIKQVASNNESELYLIIFLAGLVTTLFEPNSIFGSVQSTVIWWASIAYSEVLRLKKNA